MKRISVYRITPKAKEDLKNIGRYTFMKWGTKKRDIYLKQLDACFEKLAKNPKLGIHRKEIKEGYYCLPHLSHLIFYIIYENEIHIIGIPHKSMDINNLF